MADVTTSPDPTTPGPRARAARALAAVFLTSAAERPDPGPPPGTLVDAATARVSIPSEDGGLVSADVYGAGGRGIVPVHGGRFNKESWAMPARALVNAGFHVIALDRRGDAQSRGPGGSGGGEANDDGPQLPRWLDDDATKREPKELIALDGTAHAPFLFETDQADRLRREIVRFPSTP
jgi:hypothetical protein